METQQQAYSVAEAGKVLRVSEWLIREACPTGQLRCRRVGARNDDPRAAVGEFLAASDGEDPNAAS